MNKLAKVFFSAFLLIGAATLVSACTPSTEPPTYNNDNGGD